jgi:hypothetical protein
VPRVWRRHLGRLGEVPECGTAQDIVPGAFRPQELVAATHHGDVHAPVVKQLLIVARDRQKLYEYAKRAFAENSTVEVILDRRSAEQRSTYGPKPERRRGNRHLIQGIDNHLKALGWAIVRFDVLRTKSAVGSNPSPTL